MTVCCLLHSAAVQVTWKWYRPATKRCGNLARSGLRTRASLPTRANLCRASMLASSVRQQTPESTIQQTGELCMVCMLASPLLKARKASGQVVNVCLWLGTTRCFGPDFLAGNNHRSPPTISSSVLEGSVVRLLCASQTSRSRSLSIQRAPQCAASDCTPHLKLSPTLQGVF